MSFLSKIFGDQNAKVIKELEPIVARVNELEKDYEKLSDEELIKIAEAAENKVEMVEDQRISEMKRKYFVK